MNNSDNNSKTAKLTITQYKKNIVTIFMANNATIKAVKQCERVSWRETEWENETPNIMFKRHLVKCERKKIEVIFHVEYLIFAIGNDAPHFHHGSLSNNQRWCSQRQQQRVTVCLVTYSTQEDAFWCECNSIYSPKRGKLIESTMHAHDKRVHGIYGWKSENAISSCCAALCVLSYLPMNWLVDVH